MRPCMLLSLFTIHAVKKCLTDQVKGRCYSSAVCSNEGKTFTTWRPIPPFQSACPENGDSAELSNNITSLQMQIQGAESKMNQLSSDIEQKMNSTLSQIEEFASAFGEEISRMNQTIELMKAAYTDTSYCSMGVADGGSIPSTSLTASSEWDANHGAKYGRLNAQIRGQATGSWSALNNNVGEWIQVDFGTIKNVSGVMTQGRPNESYQWITSYKIKCGATVEDLKYLNDSVVVEKVFNGNSDRNTISVSIFESLKSCRYVRIYPQTYHNHMSLRMDWFTICN